MLAHSWPGNVRELDNAIAFAAALCEDGVIGVDDLPEQLSLSPDGAAEGNDGDELRAMLSACKGNVSEAARRLGIDRTTLHRRMKRLGVGRPH